VFGSGKVLAASIAGTIAQSLLLPVHAVHIFRALNELLCCATTAVCPVWSVVCDL
jgi:hypothetical protein